MRELPFIEGYSPEPENLILVPGSFSFPISDRKAFSET
jgi:hypothetical protein